MTESEAHHFSAHETPADCDVLIVGAGLVGATLALRLRTSGLRVGLLDKSELTGTTAASVSEPRDALDNTEQPPKFDPRVVALTAQSQQLLEHVGVWQKLKQSRHCPYTQMRVWEQDGTGEVEFDASEIHEPALGTIIENGLIVGALHARIADCLIEQARSVNPWLTLFMGRGVLKLEQRQEKGRPL